MALSHNKHTTKYLRTKQFYNGFSKVFPKEICEVILDMYFGRIARIRWYNSPLHDHIKQHSHNRFTEWIVWNSTTNMLRQRRETIETFIKNNKSYLKNQIPNAMNWYYDCRCCQRHQVQKPCICGGELCIVTKPEAFFCRDNHNHDCQCDCRHRARWLARCWMEIMNIEKGRQTDVLRDYHLFRRFR